MRISSIKTITNTSKYCLNTLFIKSMKAARALFSCLQNVTISDFEIMITEEPSFFFTNNTGVPHAKILGLMKPLSRRSFNYSFNSLSSARAILLGGIEIGWVFGRRSIPKSILLPGGTPGKSSGNNFGNSLTTGTDSKVGVSELESLTQTK
ncbi:hypothetical protein R3W88_000748 [Solanum pinnatisectum]|uniref:Uncharacterized protein n=1 Tax=Solanum pinnatisectum TaxID=50273 RepID=A0AAV9MG68_9SOLN|nr:hypothetical protein R3W88_000748 [Solanum pinnatisectum]